MSASVDYFRKRIAVVEARLAALPAERRITENVEVRAGPFVIGHRKVDYVAPANTAERAALQRSLDLWRQRLARAEAKQAKVAG